MNVCSGCSEAIKTGKKSSSLKIADCMKTTTVTEVATTLLSHESEHNVRQ